MVKPSTDIEKDRLGISLNSFCPELYLYGAVAQHNAGPDGHISCQLTWTVLLS